MMMLLNRSLSSSTISLLRLQKDWQNARLQKMKKWMIKPMTTKNVKQPVCRQKPKQKAAVAAEAVAMRVVPAAPVVQVAVVTRPNAVFPVAPTVAPQADNYY